MKILVTGAAGFIGSNFVRYWSKKYPTDTIVVYDKLTYAGNLANIADLLGLDLDDSLIKSNSTEKLSNESFHFVKGDILDKSKLESTLNDFGVDTLVHFAAETHVDRSIDSPDEFIQTNINGTFTILELLRKYPEIRFHHVSTDEVYGELPLDKPEIKFTEETPYDPRSPYSAAKAASDHLVRSYINTYGVKGTISNCSNNFGAYCNPEKLIPLIVTRALAGEEIPVYGDGKQIRDWIHAEDHALGIDLILQKGKIGETYLLGGNGERENIWIVKTVLEELGKSDDLIVHVGDRKGHDHRYAIDFSKAKNELGYEPQKSLKERLKETVSWYKENRDIWEPLKPAADKFAERYLEKRI